VKEGSTLRERQAAVRLAMQDALKWTDPETLNSESFTVLSEGIDLLGRETFSEGAEEAWLTRPMEARWDLVPSFEQLESTTEKKGR
jgi:hypothetical protein